MPKKRETPSYRYHVSGQAVVTFLGKNFKLGTYDSKESWAKYHALCHEYLANGMTAPPKGDTHLGETVITVRCVTAEFRASIEERPNELSRFNRLLTTLDDEYGDLAARDFGPRKLDEIRELFITDGNCRRYVNDQVRQIIQVFRYAVSRELIGVDVLQSLETLAPLRPGKSKAKESKRRRPVDLEDVRATVKHLTAPVAAMVRIQLKTGMRPSEVFNLRPRDVDQSGKVWVYRPEHHKTEHHGVTKVVPIVGDAREALTPFLLRDADTYCFSPAESYADYLERRRAKRTTTGNRGNRPGSNRKSNPKSRAGTKYSKDSYRQAVQRGCDLAKVPRWNPYQLRHTAATLIRAAIGTETAMHLLGHTSGGMTEHYARVSLARATDAAMVAPEAV